MKSIEEFLLSNSYTKDLQHDLTSKRYEHSIRVARTAAMLAHSENYSIKKALIAGLLHDCAKNFSKNKTLHQCEKYQIDITEAEKHNVDLLHAKVGAAIAEHHYHIADVDILSSIASHTTGKPQMNTLEKIIYVCDYIEPGRDHRDDLHELTKMARTDINEAVYVILKDTLEHLRKKKRLIDPITEQSFLYYKGLKEGTNNGYN